MTDRRYLPPSEYGGAVAGTASADVESANIVGYQHVYLPKGWSFRTATFKNVGLESIDLTDIKPMRVNKGAIIDFDQSIAGKCAGAIFVCFIDAATGNYGTAYKYYSTLGKDGNVNGWMYEDENKEMKRVVKGEVPITNGQGMIVNSSKNNNAAAFRFSGEVDLVNRTYIPKGWSFEGNSTPVDFDLVDMKPMRINKGAVVDFDQSTLGKCAGAIYIRKIDATSGNYQTTYKYYSTLGEDGKVNGWMYEDENKVMKRVVRGEVTIAAGEGFIVNSSKNTGTALMQLPSPIK